MTTETATQTAPVNFHRAKRASGWTTWCQRSPTKAPDLGAVAEGEGWEPCPHDRGTAGHEYAVEPGCSFNGFRGQAAKRYYYMVRRPVSSR